MTDRTPRPGDAGFRAYLNRASESSHLTERERFERRLLHDLIVRARGPAGEQATLRELNGLLSDGVLVEREPER